MEISRELERGRGNKSPNKTDWWFVAKYLARQEVIVVVEQLKIERARAR